MDFVTQTLNVLSGTNPNPTADIRRKPVAQRQKPREAYTNMGRETNYLPNLNTPPQNYPVENYKQIHDSSLYAYPNPNQATNTYLDQNLYEDRVRQHKPVDQNPQRIYSMSGNWLSSEQFRHSNMTPFVGGKVTGHTYDTDIAESVLDNMIGSGSQTIKKIEQAPLFKPQDNVQWPLGMPNQSDFFQSRIVPSWKDNSVKPFESERVAPGLGLGYTTQGMGGYNSGMLVREQWLDKTVDQQRVATNPKIEYDLFGHEGPAGAHIKNRGMIGTVEKNRPDRFWVQEQDRWFTTVGAGGGATTLRPIQELGNIRRDDCEIFYPGPGYSQDGPQVGRAPTAFEPTKRQDSQCMPPPTGGSAQGRGEPGLDKDAWFRSHMNRSNHRSSTVQPATFSSGFSTAIGAVLAPLTDALRPTRREELSACGKVIYTSGAKTAVPADYVINPMDILPTTIRETTLFSQQFNINNQAGAYVDNAMPGKLPQRATTDCTYVGTPGGRATTWGDMNETSYRNQTNNVDKTALLYNRPSLGALGLFNPNIGAVCNQRADSNCFDNYIGPASSVIKLPANKENIGYISHRQTDDIPGSAARNQQFVVDQFLTNPFTHPLTTSV